MRHPTRLIACLSLLLIGISFTAYSQSYDLIIRNGKIIDGTGNSWYYGDIGVKAGKIIFIGNLKNAQAATFIDAKGFIVSPGFIDVHTHIEGDETKIPTADNFILDGVTTVITGNCGSSSPDIAEYFQKVERIKTSINIATLVGHNTVRRAVVGETQRDPTAEEQLQMEALVEKAMKDGAVGLSTGLIYVPGTYAKTEEVIGLAKAAARYGGVYASHIRSEGDEVTEAIDEAIAIGEVARMPVQISHFKVTYKPNWGKSIHTLHQVEQARLRGVDVTIDQYPYIASSTSLSTTVPSWVFSGGRDSVLWRLSNSAIRLRIKQEMVETLKKKKLTNYNYAMIGRYPPDSSYHGKTITEVNKLTGKKSNAMHEAETILELIAATPSIQMVFFSMDEADLKRILQYPFNMVASDAGINQYGANRPHPRAYGTNARVLGRYVRELKVIRLEEAIRRMTSLPATKFNLRDRGLLREGMAADIVIFDEQTVADRATFTNPHAYSVGFEYVIVNGQITAAKGKHTGARNGDALKGIN
jgi:N-acyl-D-amino-acid deacylase